MQFILNPLPHMEDQRFFPARSRVALIPYVGKVFKAAIDPTCGRYCLKALLKWHKAKATGNQPADIDVGHRFGPPPQMEQSGGRAQYTLDYVLYLASNWVAYDPVINFPDAERLLRQENKPTTVNGWHHLLYSFGPIIITGVLGAASIPHVVLLVGVDMGAPGRFFFLDPLAGDVLKDEAFAAMQDRIDDGIVFGRKNIGGQL